VTDRVCCQVSSSQLVTWGSLSPLQHSSILEVDVSHLHNHDDHDDRHDQGDKGHRRIAHHVHDGDVLVCDDDGVVLPHVDRGDVVGDRDDRVDVDGETRHEQSRVVCHGGDDDHGAQYCAVGGSDHQEVSLH